MKPTRTLAAMLMAATLCCAAPAFAAPDPGHYLLTQGVMTRMKAAEADLEKSGYKAKDDDDKDDKDRDNPTVEDLVRQIDGDKAVKAALAKQGLSSRDFALTSFALLHAGFFVMMESAMDKKKAAELMATYTKEQRANIAFVRAMNLQKTK